MNDSKTVFANKYANGIATAVAIEARIKNPFDKSLLPEINLGSTPVGQLPPLVSGATPSVVNANAKLGSIPTIVGQTTAEEINEVFPNG